MLTLITFKLSVRWCCFVFLHLQPFAGNYHKERHIAAYCTAREWRSRLYIVQLVCHYRHCLRLLCSFLLCAWLWLKIVGHMWIHICILCVGFVSDLFGVCSVLLRLHLVRIRQCDDYHASQVTLYVVWYRTWVYNIDVLNDVVSYTDPVTQN